MKLLCVQHEQDMDEPSVEAVIIFNGDSLCANCFESRGGYVS